MPNGTNIGIRIIDLSLSGAGIATDRRPEVGSPVTLGKIPGRVVRHLEEGFAMEFTRLQHPDSIEENVTGSKRGPFRRASGAISRRLRPPPRAPPARQPATVG